MQRNKEIFNYANILWKKAPLLAQSTLYCATFRPFFPFFSSFKCHFYVISQKVDRLFRLFGNLDERNALAKAMLLLSERWPFTLRKVAFYPPKGMLLFFTFLIFILLGGVLLKNFSKLIFHYPANLTNMTGTGTCHISQQQFVTELPHSHSFSIHPVALPSTVFTFTQSPLISTGRSTVSSLMV